jgi:hypothetical protein
MKKLNNFLIWLRLVDAHDRTLSITSLGVFVCLFKVAVASQVGFPDLAALLLTLLSYNGKKVMQRQAEQKDVTDNAALTTLKSQVDNLSSALSVKNTFQR